MSIKAQSSATRSNYTLWFGLVAMIIAQLAGIMLVAGIATGLGITELWVFALPPRVTHYSIEILIFGMVAGLVIQARFMSSWSHLLAFGFGVLMCGFVVFVVNIGTISMAPNVGGAPNFIPIFEGARYGSIAGVIFGVIMTLCAYPFDRR